MISHGLTQQLLASPPTLALCLDSWGIPMLALGRVSVKWRLDQPSYQSGRHSVFLVLFLVYSYYTNFETTDSSFLAYLKLKQNMITDQ